MEYKMHPVHVISVCTAAGTIIPLRLQVKDNSCEPLKIQIEEIVSQKESQRIGIEAHIFLCRAMVNNRSISFELRYAIRDHTWFLISDNRMIR